jgi:hypothetical protein
LRAGPVDVEEHVSNGRAAGAMLAAGFGCFLLGVLAVAADGSKVLARGLTFYTPTGPLSGVSTVAIGLWLLVWVVLAQRWRTRTVAMGKVSAIALGLLAAGLLLTFPPFGDMLLGR